MCIYMYHGQRISQKNYPFQDFCENCKFLVSKYKGVKKCRRFAMNADKTKILCPIKYGLGRYGFSETGHDCCASCNSAGESGQWKIAPGAPCRLGYAKEIDRKTQ